MANATPPCHDPGMNDVEPLHGVGEVLLRLGAAAAIGGALGLNRDLQDKPAGLRTHAMVALGAALATYLSIEVTKSGQVADMGAVTRVIQGVLTGIGFIGAGVIFRDNVGKKVTGLTTSAEIWVVACLGMACGAGRWRSALAGFGITLVVLVFGGPFEKAVRRLLRPPDKSEPPTGST
jgi:putative Mg2+ transporter-C (MgtC) family protein